MAEVCYTARATTREQVKEAPGLLEFPKTSAGRYNYDDANTFVAKVERILRETINMLDPANSMFGLLRSSTDATNLSAIAAIKLNHVATATTVLAEAKDKAAANNAVAGTDTIKPEFETKAEAQDEADRINLACQAIIGAKEGATQAITAKVGSMITNPVLRAPGSSTTKGIDGYELHAIVEAVKQGADRPPTKDILTQLFDAVHFQFDFRCTTWRPSEPRQIG